MRPSKTFFFGEIIKVKKKQGVSQVVILWTFENVGINIEGRGSIVPSALLARKNLAQIIDWVLAKHGNARRCALAARAARDRNSSRQIVHDKIILHKAERISGEED